MALKKEKSKDGVPNGEVKTRAEAGTREMIVRRVVIEGLTPIMFSRYPGDNETKLEVWQKLYLGGENGRTISLPADAILSALSAQNTDSYPKRLLDVRKYRSFCFSCSAYLSVEPDTYIPFLREGQPIEFGKLDSKERDPQSGVYVHRAVARLEKGIPNPQVRPVLPLPWTLEFKMRIWPNRFIQEQQILNVFTEGLLAFGLGTWRGRFGKAQITTWE